jgi:hypothetical protein
MQTSYFLTIAPSQAELTWAAYWPKYPVFILGAGHDHFDRLSSIMASSTNNSSARSLNR